MWNINIHAIFALISSLATINCGEYEEVKKPMAQPNVCPCEYKFQPICGSDGITYLNKCLLECSNNDNINKGLPIVSEAADDSLCSGCKCQEIDLPVCTSDGRTYSNECELSCENIQRINQKRDIVYLAYRTACLGPPCGCSTIASPVCGSDDVLYRNLCVLQCANSNSQSRDLSGIEFKNNGACLDGCLCPDIKQPLCGSDGVEYDNPCQLACQNRKLTCSVSPTVTSAPENLCIACNCTNKYEPVCGSDGKIQPKTYLNSCNLKCDAKRTNNPYLGLTSFGVCPDCFCIKEDRPVCGTDWVTYDNECELRCKNDFRKEGDPAIGLYQSGSCQRKGCDCSYCPEEYIPMCGNDNRTYWNLCWLDCVADCYIQQKLIPVELKSRGSCYV